MKIITGKTGTNHITSDDDGAFNAGIIGIGDYVLEVGEKFKAAITSNNAITLSDGEIVMQGRHGRIEPNAKEVVKIENGAQGVNRIDTIICEYTRSGDIEKMELRAIKGKTTDAIPMPPTLMEGNIRNGDTLHQMALYDVRIEGIDIKSLTKRFEVVKGICKHEKELSGIVQRLILESDMRKYPIGSIIMSTIPDNPNTYMGFGKWSKWGKGRVPVGVDESEDEFNAVEKTGGSKTHTLTMGQMPVHSHTISAHAHSVQAHTHGVPNHTHTLPAAIPQTSQYGSMIQTSPSAHFKLDFDNPKTTNLSGACNTGSAGGGNTGNAGGGNTGNAGSGQGHNNLQPYITCYMWKRTA